MQKWFSFIPALVIFQFAFSAAFGNTEENLLSTADSLYQKKKFAEAKELYFKLYQQGYSSPASLLKMAFGYEGLGQTSHALFFLSAYYNVTEDEKAYDKILTLANARSLGGFERTDFDRITTWLQNRMRSIMPLIAASGLACLALMAFCLKRNWHGGKIIAGIIAFFSTALFFWMVNFSEPTQKAVVARAAYFMTGPSAGANFIELVNEGNQVSIEGGQDVWAQVRWKEKEGFIKKTDLLFY